MATYREQVLILCKTYPSPSATYSETSCVAGVTEAGSLIRLFPVPFRLIQDELQFRKWQWVELLVEKSRDDHRPESHRIYIDQIKCISQPLPAGNYGWGRRMQFLRKIPIHKDFDAAELARINSQNTIAMVRPTRILDLEIRPTKNPTWTEEEITKLTQMQRQSSLLSTDSDNQKQVALLEKIPYDFYYHYECIVDGQAKVYKHKLVDWEVGALYRNLRKSHGVNGWEERLRKKYQQELPLRDLIFLMGTIHRFPDQWLIISVMAPPATPRSAGHNQIELFATSDA